MPAADHGNQRDRVGIGLLGCGTVGAALVALVESEAPRIEARTGLRLEIGAVAVRDPGRSRAVELPAGVLTDDAGAVVTDPAIDVVVEVIGGIDPARALVLDALAAGKPVVTANKALLAAHGAELLAAADAAGVDLLFEAAVGGGIPIIRPLRESLLGEPVTRVLGIVNGTTNYILTRMTEDGEGYADALADAQQLGYAEADPTADVDGLDAAAKLAVIAAITFGARVTADDVHCEGISAVTADDIAFATRHGWVVKLIAVGDRQPDGSIGLRVHPALLPDTHPLAAVRGSFNAVFVEGGAVGDLMFYGPGAGGRPTASAVLGDLIDAAANRRRGAHASVGALVPVTVRSVDDLVSAFCVTLDVADRPGVLATVATVFAEHGVSIESMEQEGRDAGARIVFITHPARERDVRATLAALEGLEVVRSVRSVLRVLEEDDVVEVP